MKERLKKEYCGRIIIILKSEMNAKNKITATAALAVTVLRYSFRTTNWRLQTTEQLTGKLERH
jgi:hypothetical protein